MSKGKAQGQGQGQDTVFKILAAIDEVGLSAKGKSELVKYLNGNRITQSEAIKAKCYDCMGHYQDGKEDCTMPHCPLYSRMPYNPNRQRGEKNLTEEQRKAIGERFRK